MVQWTAVLLPQGKAQNVDKPARVSDLCAPRKTTATQKERTRRTKKKKEDAEKQRQKTMQKTAQKAYE